MCVQKNRLWHATSSKVFSGFSRSRSATSQEIIIYALAVLIHDVLGIKKTYQYYRNMSQLAAIDLVSAASIFQNFRKKSGKILISIEIEIQKCF